MNLFTGFNDDINTCSNTAPNIIMIYESWLGRDVKRNGPGIGIERLRAPSTPSVSVNLTQRLARFLTFLNDSKTLCNAYKLQ